MKAIFIATALLTCGMPAYAQTAENGHTAIVNDPRAPASTLPRSAGAPDASAATRTGENKPTATGGQPGGATDHGPQ